MTPESGQQQARISLQLRDAEEATRLAQALAPDDDGFLDINVEGSQLVIVAASPTRMGLLRSLDDVLGCLRAAGVA